MLTDRDLAAPRSVLSVARAALQGGATAIQLREKTLGASAALVLARQLRALTREFSALFFVNDRFDLALAVGADGVHLGPEDLPVAAVRACAPSPFLIGYSTDVPEEALEAVQAGADYLGVGAVFGTTHKSDAGSPIGRAGLERIIQAVSVPVVGIGGITAAGMAELEGCGAAGVAVLGAVMEAPDPCVESQRLRRSSDRL